MKVAAFIFALLSSSIFALDDDPLIRLYEERSLEGTKTLEAFKQHIIKTLCAQKDIVLETREKLGEKLVRLPTAPTPSQDSFREELFSIMNFLRPPEQFFSKEEREALIGHPGFLLPLTRGTQPLRKFSSKWKAIIAHCENLYTYAWHIKREEGSWTEFATRVGRKLSEPGLSVEDLLEINTKFVFFRGNLSLLNTAHNVFNEAMTQLQEKLPPTFLILETFNKSLMSSYERRAKILWELLRISLVLPGMPKNYDEISEEYYLMNVTPISRALELANQETDEQLHFDSISSSPAQSHAALPPNTPSSARSSARANSPSSTRSTSSADLSLRDSPSPPLRSLPDVSAPRTTPSSPQKAEAISTMSLPSTPVSQRSLFGRPSPSSHVIRKLSDSPGSSPKAKGSLSRWKMNNPSDVLQLAPLEGEGASFDVPKEGLTDTRKMIQDLSEAFVPLNRMGLVQTFEEYVHYVLNVKFIMEPLETLLASFNAYENFFLSHMEQRESILTPKASLHLDGQPIHTITQAIARAICSKKSNGPYCFIPLGFADDSHLDISLASTMGDLSFQRRNKFVPSEIGKRYTQYRLAHLFGIPCEPFAAIVVDDIRTLEIKTVSAGNQSQADFTRQYFTNPRDCCERKEREFIMVQRNPVSFLNDDCLRVNDWIDQVISGQIMAEDLDFNSYCLVALFGMLTQWRVLGDELVLAREGKDGKFTFKISGYNYFLQPAFGYTEITDSKGGYHHFFGRNPLYTFPQARRPIPPKVINEFSSHNIPLMLSYLAQQNLEQQKEFDIRIARYNLDKLKDKFFTDVDMFMVLGLSMSAWQDTNPRLIADFHRMVNELKVPGITIHDLLERHSPPEAFCYNIFEKSARKVTQRRYVPHFFEKLVPPTISRLLALHNEMLRMRVQPPYSLEDLDSIKRGATDCLATLALSKKSKQSISFEELTASLPVEVKNFFDQRYRAAVEGGVFEMMVCQHAFQDLIDCGEAIVSYEGFATQKDVKYFLKTLMPRLTEELSKKDEEALPQSESVPFTDREIDRMKVETTNGLEVIKQKRLGSFETLIAEFPPRVKAFFQQKFEEYMQNGGRLGSLAKRTGSAKEKALSPVRSPALRQFSWDEIPVFRTQCRYEYAPVKEPTSPMGVQITDLIAHADVSKDPAPQAFQVLNLLLQLNNDPKEFHNSWKRIIDITRTNFLALPSHMLNFMRRHGLHPEEERDTLEREQVQKLHEYEVILAGWQERVEKRAANPEDPLKLPSYLLRLLVTGKLLSTGLDEKDALFLTSIGDMLCLPHYSPYQTALELGSEPGCIGLASTPKGRGGIFEVHPSVGHHYLLTWSENIVKLYNSPHTLSNNARIYLASHSPALLVLYWLSALQDMYPQIEFHQWYPGKLLTTFKHLQDLLLSKRTLTIREVISTVLPECAFVIDQKFEIVGRKTQRYAVDEPDDRSSEFEGNRDEPAEDKVVKLLQNIKLDFSQNEVDRRRRPGVSNLDPVETNNYSLDKLMGGKNNMVALLEGWDQIHERGETAPTMTLSDAATEVLSRVIPADHSPQFLVLILQIASKFKINLIKITREYWSDPKILKDLVSIKAPDECVALAASLRTRLPITIKPCNRGVTISGTKGNIPILCELLSLFPVIEELAIPNNDLLSLTPLQQTLQSLARLTHLNLEQNPLQNPVPLGAFTNLRALNLSQTFIPPGSLNDLRLLISTNTKLTPLAGLTPDTYVNKPSNVCIEVESILQEPVELSEDDPLLARVASLLKKGTSQDYPLIAYILSRIAEERWMFPLGHSNISIETIPDYFSKLNVLLKLCESRLSAKQLLFAMGWRLPIGTTRPSLKFQENGNSNANGAVHNIPRVKPGTLPFEPCDLLRIEVVGQGIMPHFFTEFLPECRNLQMLILKRNELPTILESLPPLPNLQVLDLSGNNLSSLMGLRTGDNGVKFGNLVTFVLNNNKLTSGKEPFFNGLILLLKIESLARLELQSNNLTTIPLFGNLQLKYIDIRNNHISEATTQKNIESHGIKFYIDPQSE